jgi:IPT/TIG domain/FG-GAP repeat
MTHRMAGIAKAFRVPLRPMMLAALLSVALGALLAQERPWEHSAAAPTAGAVSGRSLSSLPFAAQGPISAALGADGPSYSVSAAPGAGLQARNPAQRITARFAAAGVEIASRGETVGLGLRAAGYGSSLPAVAAVLPTFDANRVLYAHGPLSEWYVNGPLGLEQGFTLARPLSQHTPGPLTLSLALSGDSRASLAGAGRSVSFSRPGASPLRYGGLVATDAHGRALHSWLALEKGRLLLRVATAGASYPVRIDPIIQKEPEQKLTASDESGGGLFGYSVALSADGNTALIGGPRDSTHGGAVWVFVRSGSGEWVQQGQKLMGAEQGGEGAGEHCGDIPGEESDSCSFGRAVALSADGNTALVGSPRDSRLEAPKNEGEPGEWVQNVGAAWVFTRSDGKWTQQGPKITGGEEAGEGRLGRSVALSADGNTALMGGSSDIAGHGAAWVFTRSSDGTWTQSGHKLTASEEVGEAHFGGSVALSGDGRTALIGGPGDRAYDGAVWVFKAEGSGWMQRAKLTGGASGGAGHFGYRVALSADGGTALVGARAEAGGHGAAWVFSQAESGWLEQGELQGAGEEGEEFGSSVTLSANGNVALVGAPHANGSKGSTWLFERSGTSWSEPGELLPAIGEKGNAWFGFSAVLSADASTALVGGLQESSAKVVKAGAVWAFAAEPRPLVASVSPNKGPAAGGTAVTITGTNFREVSAVRFGAASAAGFTIDAAKPNEIKAVSPPGTGVVDVTVTNAAGPSSTGESDRFEYLTATNGKKDTTGQTTELVGPAIGTGAATGSVLAFVATTGGTCRVSLLGRTIAVTSHSRAVLRLKSSAPGTCSGKLKLLVRVRSGKRVKTKTIAAGSFSIASGKARTVTLKLNAAGRALLAARHGRLGASLTIFRLTPVPSTTQTTSVRLALQKSTAHKK